MRPGQEVLYSPFPPARCPPEDCELATVTQTGLPHAYYVTTKAMAREIQETPHGIRLRVTRNDRTPPWHDGPAPLPATYEAVTTARHLRAAHGADLDRWRAAREAGPR